MNLVQAFLHWVEDWFTRGGKRTHALVALVGPISLCLGFLWLCFAASFKQRSLPAEIACVAGAIVTVTGWVYGIGKKASATEKPNDSRQNP